MAQTRPLLRSLSKAFRAFGLPFILLIVWALLTWTGVISPAKLPGPQSVFEAFWQLIRKGMLPVYAAASLTRLLSAAFIGIILSICLGILIGLNRYAARFFLPLFSFFQSLSGIAWTPLLIVWFGFSERTILIAVNYTVIFPVLFNTIVGVRTVPAVYINAAQTLGSSWWRTIRDVIIPGSLPNVLTGIRLGMAYGWRAIIAAEMLVAANGLGYMIFNAQIFNATHHIVLGMLMIGFLWMFLDYFLLNPLEQLTVRRWGMVQR